MTVFDAATSRADSSVAAYEELRSHVRAGSAFGGHLGLVLLLREGVAAWMTRGSASPAQAEPTASPACPAVAPVVTDEIHAGIVQVLADMALWGRGELPA